MSPHRDYYDILGVAKGTPDPEIRKAYLKLAHKYHPDKTGGDKVAEDKLKEINAAYDTLKSPEKRAKYDRFGHAADQYGGGDPGFGGSGFNQSGGGFDSTFDDLFDALFGGGGGKNRGGGGARAASQQGRDMEYGVEITLREAAFGVKKKVKFKRLETTKIRHVYIHNQHMQQFMLCDLNGLSTTTSQICRITFGFEYIVQAVTTIIIIIGY